MPIERILLDWKSPCLPQAAEWLVSRHPHEPLVDLRHFRVALPGGRAVRRLMELLVEATEAKKKTLIPPRIITSGNLPEQLYESSRRQACSFERHMAWLQALEGCSPDERKVLLPRPPDKTNINAWFSVAQRLDQLYGEVASAGLRFSDVAAHCARNHESFPDERWQVLSELHGAFLTELDTHELADVHEERLQALEENRCSFSGELILIGTSDLPLVTRRMLEQSDGRCSSLLHAPADGSLNDCFDDFGCVVAAKWTSREIPVNEERLDFARNPAEQASKIVQLLQKFAQNTPAEEISVGVCSKEAKPYLIEALAERELPCLDASGQPLDRTSPIVFLKLAADYLQSKSFFHFASLVRHPEVHRTLLASERLKDLSRARGGLLSNLDEFQSEHLQADLGETLPGGKKKGHIPTLARAALGDLLGELTGAPRNLAQWSGAIAQTVVRLFGNSPLEPHTRKDALIIAACSALHDEVSKLSSFSPAANLRISSHEAIRLLLSQLAGSTAEIGGSAPAIELLGWLELQLDDAAVMFVTSLNEGYVPESLNSDPFLPNSLRSALGLLDNERRYARDAYALSAILESRKQTHLLATRLDAKGSPLRPSRLLFACSGKKIAERIEAFFEATQVAQAQNQEDTTVADPSPPKPLQLPQAPDKMSVTGFKDYLECPYRYYLRHILKLRCVDDSALELNAAAAGTVMHAVLTAFAQSTTRSEVSEEQITDFLLESLSEKFSELFGNTPLPAVRVQRLQAEARLKAFATWQAKWCAQGWEIRAAESTYDKPEFFIEMLKGGRMQIQGRIDRVDYHPQRKEWFVFDYKTGDSGDAPAATHLRRKGWVNLQLPLYHHLLRQEGKREHIRLGYIVLPADLGKLKEEEAAWSQTEIDEALSVAKTVAQAVHEQNFWPPKKLRHGAYDDYRILFPQDFDWAARVEA